MARKSEQSRIVDIILNNKEMAYEGAIGKKRESFCVEYIQEKGEVFKEIRANQLETVSKNNETISCQKGCSHCCLAYMQASVQECEAIVYYLYHNEKAFSIFLNAYPKWRGKLRQNGDIFKECGELWLNKAEIGKEAALALQAAEKNYREQNIYCPFLFNDTCLIYEVRPFTCANLVAVTPPEWCSPWSPNKAKTYVTNTSKVIDNSFYYRKIQGTVLAFMPLVIYGILKDGYKLLSNIPGLEDLEKA